MASTLVLDSVTRLDDRHRGSVLVAGSHGAIFAAYLAALGNVRGVILNDAGIGKDRAGIAGLPWLDDFDIAGATVDYRSCRIGDGADMMDRGRISHVNRAAAALGCAPGQDCVAAATAMAAGPVPTLAPPARDEARFVLRPGNIEVIGIDSASKVVPEDRNRIVVTASHGGLLGGRPETALKYDALAAVYNDAGVGADDAGISRLPVLAARGIAAATVAADSARIGDARSTWSDGVVSHLNAVAASYGCSVGMTTVAFADRVTAVLAGRDRSAAS